MTPDTVVVLAKSPRPGLVKTRLSPVFSPAESAALAAAAIRDTLDVALATGARRTIVAWDGPAASWMPAGVRIVPQRGSSLDERLENVFHDVLEDAVDAPTLLVGMDTPQLTVDDLRSDWRTRDAVLGLSADGGYWAIGFRRYVPGAVLGVPMSTRRTGAEQLTRLKKLDLDVELLTVLRDVDTPVDAAQVARQAPRSRFGRLHRRIVEAPCAPMTLFDAALTGASVEVRVDATDADAPQRVSGLIDFRAWQRLSEADEVLLSRCEGPVLDIGCGPGRFVEALACRGLPALGVDLSKTAVACSMARGASALVRDVHDRLPAEGRWGTILLADGNIGIGGDPLGLLRRCRELLHPGAAALVETSTDSAADTRTTVTLHGPSGRHSHALPWAVVGAHALVRLAATAGFVAVEDWRVGGRAFVMLRLAG